MPELPITRGKTTGKGQKIKLPHMFESFIVRIFKLRLRGLELLIPCKERLRVVGTKVMPIFHHEKAFNGLADLRDRR